MIKFALIILVSSGSVALTTVDGFTSLAACESAAAEVREAFNYGDPVRFKTVCMQVK